MVGDEADLVRRAQRWVNGDAVDSMQIRLSAISLIGASQPDAMPDLAQPISVLKAAGRARRLTPEYRDYITGRIDLALPEDEALAAVTEALSQVAPMSQLEQQVMTGSGTRQRKDEQFHCTNTTC